MTTDINAMNAAIADACDQDATNLPEVTEALTDQAKQALLHLCAINKQLGISPLTTISLCQQLTVMMLRTIAPDGPVAAMVRNQADLVEAAEAGRDPDPQMMAVMQKNAIAMTMAARRAREGRNRPQ